MLVINGITHNPTVCCVNTHTSSGSDCRQIAIETERRQYLVREQEHQPRWVLDAHCRKVVESPSFVCYCVLVLAS